MQEQIINLLVNAQRNYNNSSLKKIRSIEEYFKFEKIDEKDVVELGDCIKEYANTYKREYSLRIADLNNVEIYKTLSSDLASRNIEFGKKKGNVVREYKHCSIYPLIMYAIGFEDIKYFDRDEVLTVAGGFPLLEDNKLKYIVEISGFKNGDDFKVFIDGLSKYLNVKVPMFDDYLV